ncbi:hypothetical protein V1521DRAFT_157937 [Lipomyces starkeyi]
MSVGTAVEQRRARNLYVWLRRPGECESSSRTRTRRRRSTRDAEMATVDASTAVLLLTRVHAAHAGYLRQMTPHRHEYPVHNRRGTISGALTIGSHVSHRVTLNCAPPSCSAYTTRHLSKCSPTTAQNRIQGNSAPTQNRGGNIARLQDRTEMVRAPVMRGGNIASCRRNLRRSVQIRKDNYNHALVCKENKHTPDTPTAPAHTASSITICAIS